MRAATPSGPAPVPASASAADPAVGARGAGTFGRTRRAARLLVPATPVATGGARQRTGVAGAVLAATAVAVALLRQPGSALDNIWAEDGSRFLSPAWSAPLWELLPEPFAGYLQFYPRTSAQVAALVEVDDAAAAMAVAGALAAGIAVLAVVVGGEGHLRSLVARAGVGLAVALVPFGGFEMAASVSNAHWYLAIATFWLLLWTPRTALGTAAATACVLFAAGSDPLTGLFAPLALVRLVAGGRGSRIVVGGFAAGLLAQLPAVLTAELWPREPGGTPGVLLALWARRVVGVAAAGFDPQAIHGPGVVALSVAGLAVAAVVAVAFAPDRGRAAAFVGLALLASVVLFTVPVGLRWHATFDRYPTPGIRYTFGPWVLVVAVGGAAVDAVVRRWRAATAPAWVAWPAALLVVCLPTLTQGTPRTPSYRDQLPAARAACAAPEQSRAVVRSGPQPPWAMAVPCDRLRPAR